MHQTCYAVLFALLLLTFPGKAENLAPAFAGEGLPDRSGKWQIRSSKPTPPPRIDNGRLEFQTIPDTVELTAGTAPEQLITLVPGRSYQWSLTVSGTGGAAFCLYADYYDENGGWMHRDESDEIRPGSDPQELRLALQLPPYCRSVNLKVRISGGGATLAGPRLTETPLPLPPPAGRTSPAEFWINVDYFDEVAYSASLGYENYGKEAIRRFFEQCRKHGVTGVHWRISLHGQVLYRSSRFTMPPGRTRQEKQDEYLRKTIAVMQEIDPLAEAVREARHNGIAIYIWVTIADEAGGTRDDPEYCASDFLLDHPEYALLNRDGKPLWGTLCYNIPAVRQYRTDMIRELSGYGADGIFLSTRSHAHRYGRDPGDEYGFNTAIADEYRKRYGVDILKEPFDLEKWHAIKAEGLDELIRKCAEILHAKGQKLRLGIADGTQEKWGWVFGNARLNWKKHLAEGWLDSIVIGQGVLTANKMIREYRSVRQSLPAGSASKIYFWMQLLEYGNGRSIPAGYVNMQYQLLERLGADGGIYHEAINLEVSEEYYKELTAPYPARERRKP